jgi:hypothetical protein
VLGVELEMIEAQQRHQLDDARERVAGRHAVARDVEHVAAHREIRRVLDAQGGQALAALLRDLRQRGARVAQPRVAPVLDPDAARIEPEREGFGSERGQRVQCRRGVARRPRPREPLELARPRQEQQLARHTPGMPRRACQRDSA